MDYRAIFNQAGPSAVAMTKELYKRAGLDLDKDIDALNAAPRLQADAALCGMGAE